MRLNADYPVVVDPAFVEMSGISYYGYVDRIVSSYDFEGLDRASGVKG
jgi:hypothetical protein